MPPTPTSVFAPVDVDDASNFQLVPRSSADDRSWNAIVIGLLAGCLMVTLLFLFRDSIVSSAPALGPLMPPKAAPRARVQAVVPPLDSEFFDQIASVILSVISLFLLFVVPLILPPVLSRCRFLSLSRWLIMAGLAFFMTTAGAAFFGAFLTVPKPHPLTTMIGNAGLYFCVFSFFGIPGCLLAAAIHPKDTSGG